jgi:hypothetical protein
MPEPKVYEFSKHIGALCVRLPRDAMLKLIAADANGRAYNRTAHLDERRAI